MSPAPITAVFVYGTLKRGQCREGCWPCDPLDVRPAWTRGQLYDTGPYPALFPGEDLVAGELWRFQLSAMPLVLKELDQVEEYTPGSEATNLYNRLVVPCTDQNDFEYDAFVYLFARDIERRFFQYIAPTYLWRDRRLALWPPEGEW